MTQDDQNPDQNAVPADAAAPAAAVPPTEPAPVAPVAPVAPPTQPPVAPAATAPGPRWRDRVFSFRAMLAVAIAGLVLGAGAGAGTALAAGDDHDGPGFRQERMGGPGQGGFPGWGGRSGQDGPPPGMGRLPPGTAPEQGEELPQGGSSEGSSTS